MKGDSSRTHSSSYPSGHRARHHREGRPQEDWRRDRGSDDRPRYRDDRSPRSRGSNEDDRRRSIPYGDSPVRSRSRSRSHDHERRYSSGSGYGSLSSDGKRPRGLSRYHGHRRSRDRELRRSPPRRSHSTSSSSDSSSSSSSSEDEDPREESPLSKDTRTVFVSQLVMKATAKDVRRYFRRKVGCKVKEVIMLRDKRTGNHKGYAYIEMRQIEDVNKAVAVTGQPPDFQRFPILVKASEAEKNYVAPTTTSVTTSSTKAALSNSAPYLTKDGRVVEAQKLYIGGLDPSVSEEHLYAIFSQFGQLEKVTMPMNPETKTRQGNALLSFREPEVANLARITMSNKILAGRPLRTGWASQPPSIPGVDIVTSDETPDDASVRAERAFAVLSQLTGSSQTGESESSYIGDMETSSYTELGRSSLRSNGGNGVVHNATVGGISTALEASETLKVTGEPSKHILVHNMFDKDTETDEGWAEDLREEFMEECSKFGKISSITVMSDQAGGKIYACFEQPDAATKCAENLSGRWFDKRRLRVEYVDESNLPKP